MKEGKRLAAAHAVAPRAFPLEILRRTSGKCHVI